MHYVFRREKTDTYLACIWFTFSVTQDYSEGKISLMPLEIIKNTLKNAQTNFDSMTADIRGFHVDVFFTSGKWMKCLQFMKIFKRVGITAT